MKQFWAVCGISVMLSSGALGQNNAPGPAELPPEGFEGREFVDSEGCVFMRSTFGGEVTWVPRFGPDRQRVCDAPPTFAEAAPAPDPAPSPEPDPAPVAEAPEAAPAPAARTPRAPRPRQADASGRHPDCPAKAPYGQLVDTTLGRPLVRCVTSPSLFIGEYVDGISGMVPAHVSPRARLVQVGSFIVPGNATRLQARLHSLGFPVRLHHVQGFDVVSVGPFESAGQAHSALAQMRGLGFSDAFLR